MNDPLTDPLAALMFASSPLGMALLSLEGRVERTNAAFCELTDSRQPSPQTDRWPTCSLG